MAGERTESPYGDWKAGERAESPCEIFLDMKWTVQVKSMIVGE